MSNSLIKNKTLWRTTRAFYLFWYFGNEVLEILFCIHVKKGLLPEHFNKNNSYYLLFFDV